MALVVDESIAVAAPPETVWRLLEDPTTWTAWWPACVEARTADRRLIRDGSVLELALRPPGSPCGSGRGSRQRHPAAT